MISPIYSIREKMEVVRRQPIVTFSLGTDCISLYHALGKVGHDAVLIDVENNDGEYVLVFVDETAAARIPEEEVEGKHDD